MSREQNFLTSFRNQFIVYTGWSRVPPLPKQKIPLSYFTAFGLECGKARYTNYDLNGKATRGEQEFLITIYFTKPQYLGDAVETMRSDAAMIVEHFVNDPVFAPPVVIPGDTYRIDQAQLVEIDSTRYIPGDTRFTLVIRGRFMFTLF